MRRAGGEGLSPVQLALAVAVAPVLAILVGLWLAGLGGALRGLLPGRGDEAAGPPGDVTITSDPAGAQVLVDGKVRGHMPLTLSQPGERRLLSGAGYGWLDEHWRGVKIEDRLRARLRHACERAIDRCLADQSYEAALGLLRPLFEEDYTDQAVARQLLTVYGHLGDRASVLSVDRMVRQALKRTLFDGLTEQERAAVNEEACAPARETRLLVARLLQELPAGGVRTPG